jgi:hypothetical protein
MHSRPRFDFFSPCEARSTCATRCQVRSQNSSSVLKNLLPFGTSRSLWLVAPNLISNEEACPCESPDFPSLPTAPETISHLLSAADHTVIIVPRPAYTAETWHPVTPERFALCSPPPVLPGCGSMLWCASACVPSRSPPLDAAFRSPAAVACLAACFRSRVNVPGLHLRSDPEICARPVRSRAPAPVRLFLPYSGCVQRTTPVAKSDSETFRLFPSLRSPLGPLESFKAITSAS